MSEVGMNDIEMGEFEPPRRFRWIKRALICIVILIVAALTPVIWVETSCYAGRQASDDFQSKLSAEYRRDEVNSYLTYPEWSIVHAYEDLAAVTQRGSESDFGYWSRISSYWNSLCSVAWRASSEGQVSGQYRTMLHIIGVSFSAEMAVKGLYERTIGAVTAWLRGEEKTSEDLFALQVADDYAAFLKQTPWYEFPFMQKLSEFWSQTPFGTSNWLRAIERRIALTLEYGGKALYAQGIGALAAAAPAELRIRSIVGGGYPVGIDELQIVERIEGGTLTVIETPRYAAFTEIVKKLAAVNISFTEIAGNDDIMIALIEPAQSALELAGTVELFTVPIDKRPDYRRRMVSVPVAQLSATIRQIEASNAELEHIYDY